MAKTLTKAQRELHEAIQDCARLRRGNPEISYNPRTGLFCRAYRSRYSERTFGALVEAGLLVRVSLYDYRLPDNPAPAPVDAPAFDVGDKVRFSDDVAFFSDDLRQIADSRVAMPVTDTADSGQRIMITVPDFGQLWFYASELELWQPVSEVDTLRQERDTARQQFAALVTEIDLLNVSSSSQVQVARRNLLERAGEISPEARSLMDSNLTLRQERDKLLVSEQAYHEENERLLALIDEVRDMLRDAMGEWLPVAAEHLPANLTGTRAAIDLIDEALNPEDERPILDTMLNQEGE